MWAKHGWSRDAAISAEEIGETLRQKTLKSGNEWASIIDVQTGQQVGRLLEGDSMGVVIAEHLGQLAQGKGYVQIHTHPGSSSFSDRDVNLLYYHQWPDRNIKTIHVVGDDGTRYLISRKQGARVADPETICSKYRIEIYRLSVKWKPRVLSGEITEEQAWKELTHEVWENTADELGLIYNRVE